MLTRRLTLAVIATLFAASSSLAMLQNAGPAAARPHDHRRHHEHHQRFDRDPHYAWTRPHRDRDDRHWRAAHTNGWNGNDGRHGNHNGWNNPNNPHDAGYHGTGKPHIDPWRDHDRHR